MIYESLHIKVTNVPCPTCGAPITRPCRAESGRSHNFKYSHAARMKDYFRLEKRGKET
jgi:hypothetical protein